MRSIYPKDIPGYRKDWFADYMLPEGAHNRDLDYTYIFLNRNSFQIDEEYWTAPIDNTLADSAQIKNVSREEREPFLYGINLVKTKFDSAVRRGATVKAICVFSKYHFVEILKKPLDMALEKYFQNPSVDVLRSFFESLNGLSLSGLPRPDFLEQCLMRRGVCYDPIAAQSPNYQPKTWYRTLHYTFDGVSKQLSLPIYRTPDEVGDISVSHLVRIFGSNFLPNILQKNAHGHCTITIK